MKLLDMFYTFIIIMSTIKCDKCSFFVFVVVFENKNNDNRQYSYLLADYDLYLNSLTKNNRDEE